MFEANYNESEVEIKKDCEAFRRGFINYLEDRNLMDKIKLPASSFNFGVKFYTHWSFDGDAKSKKTSGTIDNFLKEFPKINYCKLV